MGDLILCVDDDDGVSVSSSSSTFCRICHEGELESCKRLEAPCACSGTIKFAHRDCIRRWCSEKGNAICEICLQKFEPGYCMPLPNKEAAQQHSIPSPAVTIRVSVGIPSNQELPSSMAGEEETHHADCSSAATINAASCCRSLAIIFTILLLFRHVLALLCEGTGDYPFTLPTVSQHHTPQPTHTPYLLFLFLFVCLSVCLSVILLILLYIPFPIPILPPNTHILSHLFCIFTNLRKQQHLDAVAHVTSCWYTTSHVYFDSDDHSNSKLPYTSINQYQVILTFIPNQPSSTDEDCNVKSASAPAASNSKCLNIYAILYA